MTTPNNAPDYVLTIAGRDITPKLEGLLLRLTLTESRGDEADQLDIELDDSSGRVNIPPTGEKIGLQLGWAGGQLVDKGEFVVDEVEHRGAPDVLSIRARSADMKSDMRTRREGSHHGQTLGDIVRSIAARQQLKPRVADELASIPIAHIDQTHESDLNFLSRLARRHDAVATVKKGHLIFQRINSATTASGAKLHAVTITRADGDGHRWHRAERDTYSGVKAEWQDTNGAKKRAARTGTEEREKKLRDIYATEADAMAAAKAEMQRIERGAATLELNLALARPDIAPQSPCTASGWGKPEIDSAPWLVKTCTHSLDASSGFTTRIELETQGSDKDAKGDE